MGLDAAIKVTKGDFDLDVRLSIDPGETLALLGPNGAGKSTTVDALGGMLAIQSGHISVNGRTLDKPSEGIFLTSDVRRIGIVFQRYYLFGHMTVLDNVAFGPLSQGQTKRHARQSAQPWLEALDLVEIAHQKPGSLSGGQAQRVALARALASDAELLLLDEPLAALDVATRNGLRRTLAAHLASYGGPRLLITHDPADAFLLGDRIAILEEGRVTQVGTPDDIRRRPATRYAAAVAGTNLLRGTNLGGDLKLEGVDATLKTSDTGTTGDVLVTIHPSSVSLHREEPHGSPRNTWRTIVEAIEPLGDTTRISLGAPLALSVDITPGATAALELERGVAIWASVKATEIGVNKNER
ncbi:UNVERIFIED_CONTAM: hypothetical protein GTU68_009084 [Idotea baltica]|nr:hypothetical protein [Idotea baltica]